MICEKQPYNSIVAQQSVHRHAIILRTFEVKWQVKVFVSLYSVMDLCIVEVSHFF